MRTRYLDNYYARLGVAKNASQDEIQTAYRRAARQLHPDHSSNPGANELFLLVQEAYDVLSQPAKRKRYNASLPEGIDGPTALMVNTLYSRQSIRPASGPQTIYVLLDLMAAQSLAQQATRPPLNLCLVLDTSTSMAGSRLGQVAKAASQFIGQLQEQDILSVVAFNDRAEVILPASSGQDNQRIISRLSTLQSSGGTEIFTGLEAGLVEIQKHLTPSFVNHLVLITDGRTYGDESSSLKLAEQAGRQGISISAIGIGESWNEDFVDAMVGKTGGSSVYVDKSAEIHQLLEGKLSALNRVFAKNVKLDIQAGAQSQLRYAFRLSPELGGIMSASPLILGAVPQEGSLSVLLEFEVGPPAKGSAATEIVIASGEMYLEIPTRTIPIVKTRFELALPVSNETSEVTPPQSLVNAIGRLSLYRMQEDARLELRSGNTAIAAKRMRTLATHLLSAGERQLANTVLMAAEGVQKGQALDAKSGKQIKYGTRALINQEIERKA